MEYSEILQPSNNHFLEYSNVKAKEERRPTVNELPNQRAITQKASSWKLFHLSAADRGCGTCYFFMFVHLCNAGSGWLKSLAQGF